MSKKKSEARRIDHKTWISVGLAIVALFLVVCAIVGLSQNEKIESNYFASNDKKIVLTMNRDTAALDDSEYEPEITHVVYYIDGDKITGVRAFYEYPNEQTAKNANEHLTLGEFATAKALSGRFVIFQVKEDQYKDMTVTELKKNIELLKEIDALVLDYDLENGIKSDYVETWSDDNSDKNDESGESSESSESSE